MFLMKVIIIWKSQNEFITTVVATEIYISGNSGNYGCDSKFTYLLYTVLNATFWEKGSSTHSHTLESTPRLSAGSGFKTQGRPLRATPQALWAVCNRGGSGGGAAPQQQQPAVLASVAQSRAERSGTVPLLHLGTRCLLCLWAPNTQWSNLLN